MAVTMAGLEWQRRELRAAFPVYHDNVCFMETGYRAEVGCLE